jgi:signal transduction histidine kinase/DNA-binding response OmpR family regulator
MLEETKGLIEDLNFPIIIIKDNQLIYDNGHELNQKLFNFLKDDLETFDTNSEFMFKVSTRTIKGKIKRQPSGLQLAWLFPEDYNTDKNAFISTFSHEIRTPLNGIMGITSLLSETRLSDIQKDYVDMIKESSFSLLAIVNDILDYSNIEKGVIEISTVPFKLSEMVAKSHHIMLSKATDKHLELSWLIHESVPEHFIGDSQRINQILVNLLSNGIKFTKKGFVKTIVTYADGILKFSIIDSGIGISEKYKYKLFTIHSQNIETQRDYSGTGLGLLISRRLTELMNGRIYLKSSVKNKGSEFVFEIPLKSVTINDQNEEVMKGSLKGKHVLIVDDNSTNRISISGMVHKWGMIPVPVSSLNEALITSNSIAFDIGLIDVQLENGVSGLDIAKRLGKEGHKFPLIALSSLGDKIPNFKDYFKYHLTKPVREQKLFNCVYNSLYKDGTLISPVVNNSTDIDKFSKYRILLAEDTYVNQRVIHGFFDKLGYTNVTIVENGLEVLDLLKKFEYDIIFLDIKMPFGGIETFKEIKTMFHGKPRPKCIALTAYVLNNDSYTNSYGFDDFLYKPCSKENLLSILSKFNV